MSFLSAKQLAFIFGVLGNIVAFMVFLAPVPTFYTIYKKKTSEGFKSIPYSVALFSAILLMYYAILKTNEYLIISINSIGIVIESCYLIIYMVYATNKEKRFTFWLLLLFNVGGMGLIVLLTMLLVNGLQRVTVVGWICAIINLAVFAAPLSVMREVIRTKSVEFLPFTLSFFLTLTATMWFFYGFFKKDFYIAVPNVIGFLFGIAQMGLYYIYKDAHKDTKQNFEKCFEENANKAVELDLEMQAVFGDKRKEQCDPCLNITREV